MECDYFHSWMTWCVKVCKSVPSIHTGTPACACVCLVSSSSPPSTGLLRGKPFKWFIFWCFVMAPLARWGQTWQQYLINHNLGVHYSQKTSNSCFICLRFACMCPQQIYSFFFFLSFFLCRVLYLFIMQLLSEWVSTSRVCREITYLTVIWRSCDLQQQRMLLCIA